MAVKTLAFYYHDIPAFDPLSMGRIDEFIDELCKEYRVIQVTRNLHQAARVSNFTGFLPPGTLMEYDAKKKIFTVLKNKQTEDYVSGRFG